MSEFAYQGFRITSSARTLLIDHGYYGPAGTRIARQELLREDVRDVAIACDSSSVRVTLRDGSTYQFGPLPGLESQNVFWIEAIDAVEPHAVEGDYAAKTLALFDAIRALM